MDSPVTQNQLREILDQMASLRTEVQNLRFRVCSFKFLRFISEAKIWLLKFSLLFHFRKKSRSQNLKTNVWSLVLHFRIKVLISDQTVNNSGHHHHPVTRSRLTFSPKLRILNFRLKEQDMRSFTRLSAELDNDSGSGSLASARSYFTDQTFDSWNSNSTSTTSRLLSVLHSTQDKLVKSHENNEALAHEIEVLRLELTQKERELNLMRQTDFKCTICHATYSFEMKVSMNPCGHKFCRNCVEVCSIFHEAPFPCPTCKIPVSLEAWNKLRVPQRIFINKIFFY